MKRMRCWSPHAREPPQLWIDGTVPGRGAGLATHFWKGAGYLVVRADPASGPSPGLLDCGGPAGRYPYRLSGDGQVMAPSVAQCRHRTPCAFVQSSATPWLI